MKNCPTCLAKLPKDFSFKGKYVCTKCFVLKPESEFHPKTYARKTPALKQVTSVCKACNRIRVNNASAKKRDKKLVE